MTAKPSHRDKVNKFMRNIKEEETENSNERERLQSGINNDPFKNDTIDERDEFL
jgi:hypothetical protein